MEIARGHADRDLSEYRERVAIEHANLSLDAAGDVDAVPHLVDDGGVIEGTESLARDERARVEVEDLHAPEAREHQACVLGVDGGAEAAPALDRVTHDGTERRSVERIGIAAVQPFDRVDAAPPRIDRAARHGER